MSKRLRHRAMRLYARTAIAAPGMIACSVSVLAQGTTTPASQAAQSGTTTLPPVSVTAPYAATPYYPAKTDTGFRISIPPSEVPQSLQTITRTEIDQRGVRNLGEALWSVPTATTSLSRSLDFYGGSYLVRGQSVRIIRDGIRGRFFDGVDPNALANVERIEVLKGPASASYGLGSFGAVINLITRKPLRENQLTATAIAGAEGRVQGTMDATGPMNESGTLRFRLIAEGEYTNLPFQFGNMNRQNVSLAIDWDATERLRFNLLAEYQRRDLLRYPGIPLYGVAGRPVAIAPVARDFFGSDPNFHNVNTYGDNIRLTAEYDLAPRWVAKVTGQTAGFNAEFDQVSLTTANPTTNTVTRTFRNGSEHDRDYNLIAQVSGEFETGPFTHKLAFGTDQTFFHGNFHQNGGGGVNGGVLGPFNIFNPVYGIARPTGLRNNTNQPDQWYMQHGFWVQNQMSITDRLKVLGGVRYDRVTYSVTVDGVPRSFASNGPSWNIGTSYEVVDGVTLFAGYATGFDPENVRNTRTVNGNVFDPETSYQWEVGVKLAPLPGLRADIAVFEAVRSNVLTPDPSNPGFSVQTGKQRTRGVELNGSWEVQSVPGLSFIGGYAYQEAIVLGSNDPTVRVGNTIANVPRHSVLGWVRYEVPDGRFAGVSVGTGLRYSSDRFGTNVNSYRLGEIIDWNATIGARLNDKVRVDVFAINLLDRKNYIFGGSTTAFPAAPRTVYGRLSVTF